MSLHKCLVSVFKGKSLHKCLVSVFKGKSLHKCLVFVFKGSHFTILFPGIEGTSLLQGRSRQASLEFDGAYSALTSHSNLFAREKIHMPRHLLLPTVLISPAKDVLRRDTLLLPC